MESSLIASTNAFIPDASVMHRGRGSSSLRRVKHHQLRCDDRGVEDRGNRSEDGKRSGLKRLAIVRGAGVTRAISLVAVAVAVAVPVSVSATASVSVPALAPAPDDYPFFGKYRLTVSAMQAGRSSPSISTITFTIDWIPPLASSTEITSAPPRILEPTFTGAGNRILLAP